MRRWPLGLLTFVFGCVQAGVGTWFLDEAWQLGTMSGWALLAGPGLVLMGFGAGLAIGSWTPP